MKTRFRIVLSFFLVFVFAAATLIAAALVDLNTASQKDLEALKGVGPATAKKIIAARPYASVDELSKAGLSAKQISEIKPLVTVSAAAAPAAAAPAKAAPAKAAPAKAGKAAPAAAAPAAASGPLDLNTASEKDLEALKGVGPATAKKIIAGRPYTSVDQLSKAGLNAKLITELKPMVTVGAAAAAPAPPAQPAAAAAAAKAMPKGAAPAAAGPLDLNSASEKDLEALKGVGPATAKKIIAGRPYKSVDDLGRAGVPAKTIAEIRPMVMVGAAPAAAAAAAPAPAAPAAKPAAAPAPTAPASMIQPKTPASKTAKLAPGQTVNINTASLEQLEALPGIGPVKAQAIIAARPFATIEDVMKVKGIKQGEFGKIKDLITVK